jgi:hypothetical protein
MASGMLQPLQSQDDWSEQLSPSAISKLEQNAAKHWDNFYLRNQDRFFKNRMYLSREFPLLAQPEITVLEVGAFMPPPQALEPG